MYIIQRFILTHNIFYFTGNYNLTHNIFYFTGNYNLNVKVRKKKKG